MTPQRRELLADLVIGGVVGAIIGAIAAVNFVIYIGIEGGYEASISDVFRESVPAGVVTVLILIAGPVVGIVVKRRLRRRR